MTDPRVDDLRQQLRSLGYLDAGVDRFVLAPARQARRPAAIALLSSLRVGLVAALLLGPAAAIGISGRLPGLVTGPRDAVVIAAYLAIAFGIAVTLITFIASVVLASVSRRVAARRVRHVAIAGGIVVTLACLAYLTLWWRTASAGAVWSSPIWTAVALIVAVIISLLLGHAVTVTAVVVLMAGGRLSSDMAGLRATRSYWKLSIAAGAIAFLGAAALLVLTAEPLRQPQTAALTVRSSGTRLTVLAIDGFDPDLYDQLRPGPASDTPPLLFSVFDRARADLSPDDSRDPARLWTTIATGRRAEVHGVNQLETRRVAGLQGRLASDSAGRLLGSATDVLRLTRPAIASNVERRVQTFWEVAARAGLRTAVINWWVTWPADPSAGTIVSDRAILRLEHGGALDAEIAPATLYDELKSKWPTLHGDAKARATNYFAITDPRYLPPLAPDIKAVLVRSGELDGAIINIARAISANGNFDLFVVYLPGLDIAQHALFGVEAPSPSQIDERLAALRRYYAYIDGLVSATVGSALTSETNAVVVVTQPGRLHQGKGILAGAGAGFTAVKTSGSALDIAPTILHALGVPVAKDLDGHPIAALFRPDFISRYPVRVVETYGLKGTASGPRSGQPLDDEMIERLRSLGYVR